MQEICDELIDNFIEKGEAELAYGLFTALPAIITLEMLGWESENGIFTRIPDFEVQWDGVERFQDCGSVYAVRHLPVRFRPGPRRTPA